MRAHFPRCYVDVNREPYELDPRMFEAGCPRSPIPAPCGLRAGSARWRAWSAMPRKSTTSAFRSARRYAESIGLYKPYHRTLRRLFTKLHRDFGAAILVDCHSMPSTTGSRDERPRADVVIGDRYGTSCVGMIAETVEQTLREFGYAVSRNKPYAGGFITEHYGNPTTGLHAVQLEINRALYMDERRYERSPSFDRLAAELEALADRLAEIPLEELRPYRAAAE